MKDKIIEQLKQIEKEKGVNILFAVENGSRAWRMNSEDSDYDVRFVYVYPLRDYLRAFDKPDVIKVEGEVIDILGMDIYKFAHLLWSSNPTAIEWLESDILYYGDKPKELIEFKNRYYKPISLFYHYASMCKQNYLKYIRDGSSITYKKYLYSMRGLVNALYVADTELIPSIKFTEVLDEMNLIDGKNKIPDDVYCRLLEVIEAKKSQREQDAQNRVPLFDNYIEGFLKFMSERAPENKGKMPPNTVMDDIIINIVLESSDEKFIYKKE